MYQSIAKNAPPPAIPGHLTHVKLRTVGNLTQNVARLVGHLNFVSKHLSVVGNKRILQFFDSAHAPHSQVIPCGFFCCCRHIIAWKVWSEDKQNKKYVVTEIFAELVSKGIKAILFIFVYFMNMHGVTECCIPRVLSQINIHIFKASLSFGDLLCLHTLFVG